MPFLPCPSTLKHHYRSPTKDGFSKIIALVTLLFPLNNLQWWLFINSQVTNLPELLLSLMIWAQSTFSVFISYHSGKTEMYYISFLCFIFLLLYSVYSFCISPNYRIPQSYLSLKDSIFSKTSRLVSHSPSHFRTPLTVNTNHSWDYHTSA